MSEVGNCRFIIGTLNLHQSLIQCLSCCPSCTTLVVPHITIAGNCSEVKYCTVELVCEILSE